MLKLLMFMLQVSAPVEEEVVVDSVEEDAVETEEEEAGLGEDEVGEVRTDYC